MTTSKRPAPRKSVRSPEEQEEALTQNLLELAQKLAHQDGRVAVSASLRQKTADLDKLIKKCLYQKNDDILYEAIERAKYEDHDAYLFLKDNIEEASEIIVFRRDNEPDLEVNAFVIPLFAHTKGGLHEAQCFQDQEAFELLSASLKDAQLESPDAKIVLVSHAYHLDEIDRISYSELNEMVREAFMSMTGKKAVATPAILRSMSGWPETRFTPEDQAVELRFLLGFALKTIDDPFYQVPKSEAAADRYFEVRATRFQRWTQTFAPYVKRCLVANGTDIDVNFLYQDLFFGGKEQGTAEYHMLQVIADLRHGLHTHDVAPESTRAMIGPCDADGEMMLRVNLHAKADGALLASLEKPLDIGRDLQVELDDVCDALATVGVTSLEIASKFDADNRAVDVRPYKN
jgi:hypothetical protein